jgi:hypothetical protein
VSCCDVDWKDVERMKPPVQRDLRIQTHLNETRKKHLSRANRLYGHFYVSAISLSEIPENGRKGLSRLTISPVVESIRKTSESQM